MPEPDERKNEGGRHEAARFAAQREVHVAEDPGVERGVPARGLVSALVCIFMYMCTYTYTYTCAPKILCAYVYTHVYMYDGTHI